MIQLQNNCYCSEIKVSPKNWDKAGASIKSDWYIHYRFYDPTVKDDTGKLKPLQRSIRGMNGYKSLGERRAVCKGLIENEIYLLKEKGFNPFTGTVTEMVEFDYEIDPSTEVAKALKLAVEKSKWDDYTKSNVTSNLNFITTAMEQLRFANIPVSSIKFRHLAITMAHLEKTKGTWSGHMHNSYRTSLIMMFDVLLQKFAVEENPAKALVKAVQISKIKKLLTDEERTMIDEHLKSYNPTFWRFVNIFFHSGARVRELLKVRVKDVDLKDQSFLVTVKKGKSIREVRKTIKDIALPFWEDLLKTGNEDDYVFGRKLSPTKLDNPIRYDQIKRRWKVQVMEKLKIKAEIYSLKSSNTTETVDVLGTKKAAEMNSHTTDKMVIQIYDQKAGKRKHEELKSISNAFAKTNTVDGNKNDDTTNI